MYKTPNSINNYRSRNNKGEKHPRAKLTQENVNEIRRLVSQGATQKSVATLFKVSTSRISSIARGESWSSKV